MALEDKIVQRAIVEILNAVYEADFLGFSYEVSDGCALQETAEQAPEGGLTAARLHEPPPKFLTSE